jgi:hypothetical protein
VYPKFIVPGVEEKDVWRLFNTSNYHYYKQTVQDLREGKCPFCQIDPAVNTVLYENSYWRLWKNTMAPRSGQECQLVIPSVRHIERRSQITPMEWGALMGIQDWAQVNLGIGDHGVWVLRSGDPARNAKSVPHLHANFHYPTGESRVEVTIAKSKDDLIGKLTLLGVWEKYRVAEEAGHPNPQEAVTEEEWVMIADRMLPPATKK